MIIVFVFSFSLFNILLGDFKILFGRLNYIKFEVIYR